MNVLAKYKQEYKSRSDIHDKEEEQYTFVAAIKDEEVEEDLPTKLALLQKKQHVGRLEFVIYGRRFVEQLGQEYLLLITFKEMIFFVVFLIMLSLLMKSQMTYYSNQLYNVMRNNLIENNHFDSISTVNQMWDFLEAIISDDLYYDYWYYPTHKVKATTKEDRALFYTTKLLGVPRLRQLKVRNDSCAIHPSFQRRFFKCYGRFTKENESRKPFGLGSGTAWTYSKPTLTDLSYYWGEIEFYPGGGFLQDLALTKSGSLKLLKKLEDNLWVRRGTRAIFFEFSTYNVNVNTFSVIRIVFELPPTGGIIQTFSIQNFKLLRYLYISDYFYLAAKMFILVYMVYLFLETVNDIQMRKWRILTMFWPYVDLTSIGLGFCVLVTDILLLILGEKQIKVVLANTDKFINLYNVAQLQRLHNLCLAFFIFFGFIKVFKYMNYSKRMSHLRDTLLQSKVEMFSFGFMFIIALAAFSILGYMLFGMTVEKLRTFPRTFLTLLNAILVTLDFGELERANHLWAPIFWMSYIFIITFVLLNMYIAIINHTYFNVKTTLQIEPEKKRMNWFIKRGIINMLKKTRLDCILYWCSKKEPPKSLFMKTKPEMAKLLRHVGYSEDRIQMFYQQCGIHPTNDLTGEEVERLYKYVQGNIDPISKAKEIPTNIFNKDCEATEAYYRHFARLDKVEVFIKKELEDIESLKHYIELLEYRIDALKGKKQSEA